MNEQRTQTLDASTYQTVPVSCPSCNNRFASPVLTIIDANQNPEAKAYFLAGQINIAVCPQCGYAGMLSTPLLYHDVEKELLFTYSPAELGLSELEQQRIIGDLTNRLMSTLPVEQRKGYLLSPRSFLRLEGMVEAVLEADGITPEMLEAQRAKADLLERLLRTTTEEARRLIAQENEEQIDYEFLQLLSLNIQMAQASGQEKAAQELLGLRSQVLNWTEAGQDVAAREEAIKELGGEITRDGLLDKLVRAALAGEQAKIETMVTIARPAIDYSFYQLLTERLTAAEQAGKKTDAEALRVLRQDILDLTAEIDAEVQQATQQAAELLQKILQSDDLEEAVRTNLRQIDELFLSVLAMNLDAAEQAGRADDLEKLGQIGDILMKLIQESQPPEIRLINELLAAEYPKGTQRILERHHDEVNRRLLEAMRLIGEDLAQNEREEAAGRLAQIREQAARMLGAVSADLES
jgi:hypothetical protein